MLLKFYVNQFKTTQQEMISIQVNVTEVTMDEKPLPKDNKFIASPTIF